MAACARAPRPGQSGTWIGPEMRAAYQALHQAGHAHSVETWIDGQLVAGLYCVAVGHAVFGESMFTAWCRRHGVPLIDCQQNTHHLASLGAAEMPRADFARQVRALAAQPPAPWRFEPVYWTDLLSPSSA